MTETNKRDPRALNSMKDDELASSTIRMRVTPKRKNLYVEQANAEGLTLSEWIQKHMDKVCDEA